MSAAALTAAATALWPGFRRVLRAVGRWIVKWIKDKGVKVLLGVMGRRIAAIRKGIAKAIAYTASAKKEAGKRHGRMTRRRRQGRLARWENAAWWISQNAKRLTKATVLQFEALAGHIPNKSPWDKVD